MTRDVANHPAIRKSAEKNARFQGLLRVMEPQHIALPPATQPFDVMDVGRSEPALAQSIAVDRGDFVDGFDADLTILNRLRLHDVSGKQSEHTHHTKNKKPATSRPRALTHETNRRI